MCSKQDSTPFRIAVIGGGIGGLFCTLAIHHHCTAANVPVEIDVYEQASQYKEIGAGVGVGINAARLAHKLGIGERLNAVAGHRTGVWISFRRFDNSDEIITLPVDESQTVRQAPCARSDLLDLLKEAVEERKAAALHTKKACENIEVSLRRQFRYTSGYSDAYYRTWVTKYELISPTQRQRKPTWSSAVTASTHQCEANS